MAAATIALLVFIVLRWKEVQRLGLAITQVNWYWLPAAVLAEAFFQTNEAAIYWVMFRIMGYRTRLGYVIKLALATTFANKVAPSGGVSGTSVFVERMTSQGVPPAV